MQSTNHTATGVGHHAIVVTSTGSAATASIIAAPSVANRPSLVSATGRLGNSVTGTPSSFAVSTVVTGAFEMQQQQVALQPPNDAAVSNLNTATSAKLDSALTYLAQVKRRLASDHPTIYSGFIDALRDFKFGKIDPQTALARVRQLFRSHPDLVTGFVAFLPPGMPVVTQTPANAAQNSQSKQPQKYQQQQPPPHEEFNHAIAYVNKIKSRFAGRSAVYKQFLEILHRYQKEQRAGRVHSEAQVLAELDRLFGGQSDLLEEFALFLPHRQQQRSQSDAASAAAGSPQPPTPPPPPPPPPAPSIPSTILAPLLTLRPIAQKRPRPSSPSHSSLSTMPKRRAISTATATDASGSSLAVQSRMPPPLYHETRRRRRPRHPPVRAPSPTPESLIADAAMFDAEAARFLERVEAAIGEPEVHANFLRCLNLYATGRVGRQDFLERAATFLRPFPDLLAWLQADLAESEDFIRHKKQQQQRRQQQQQQRPQVAEIDALKIQLGGGSYRVAPRSFAQPRCSGRDHLPPACREALNDNLVSFPSWLSEDTQGGGRRNQYEEACCRVEDERYELDMVLEVNQAAVRALESTYKRLQRLASADELARYRLGDDLCGGSAVLQRQAIYRVYGDHSHAVIQCLQENPAVAVPLVLRRLKAKGDEWREAQKAFNKIWREQIDKNYAKSLDHQGQAFKQADLRQMRTRALVNDIVTTPGQTIHLAVPLDSAGPRKDAVYLLGLQAKRLTGAGLEERAAMHRLLRRWLRDVTGDSRLALDGADTVGEAIFLDDAEQVIPTDRHPLLGNSAIYSFLRLFHLLSERIAEVKLGAAELAAEWAPNSAATAASRSTKIYAGFLHLASSLINGGVDPASFEDRARDLLGSRHYRVFTLDKLLSIATRQLHSLVTDEASKRLLRLFYAARNAQREAGDPNQRRGRPDQPADSQQEQQVYRISLDQRDRVLTIRLQTAPEQPLSSSTASVQQRRAVAEDAAAMVPSIADAASAAQNWCRYLLDLQRDDADAAAVQSSVFLARNRRRCPAGLDESVGASCWDLTELRLTEQQARLRLVQAAGSESLFYRRRQRRQRPADARHGQLLEEILNSRLASSVSPADAAAASAWLLGETPGLLRPGLRTERVAPPASANACAVAVYRTSAIDPTAGELWPVSSQSDLPTTGEETEVSEAAAEADANVNNEAAGGDVEQQKNEEDDPVAFPPGDA